MARDHLPRVAWVPAYTWATPAAWLVEKSEEREGWACLSLVRAWGCSGAICRGSLKPRVSLGGGPLWGITPCPVRVSLQAQGGSGPSARFPPHPLSEARRGRG